MFNRIGSFKLIGFSRWIEKFISKRFDKNVGINLEDISIRPYGDKIEIRLTASGLIDASDYEKLAQRLGV